MWSVSQAAAVSVPCQCSEMEPCQFCSGIRTRLCFLAADMTALANIQVASYDYK